MSKQIEIFRPGTFTAMDGSEITFSEADLKACAAGYDAALHEAPVVIGHPKTDDPAWAWTKSLSFADGKLVADVDEIDPAFAEMVKAKRFKKISPSFYRPDAKGNPKPGAFYLRHIGFLGAQPPSVKGLKQVSFSEDDDGTISFADPENWSWTLGSIGRLFRRLRDQMIADKGLEATDKVITDWDISAIEDAAVRAQTNSPAYAEPTHQEPTVTDKTAEQRVTDLDKREKEIKDRETAFAEKEKVVRSKADEALLDQLIKDGKFSPAKKAETLAFMATLDASEAVAFAEGGDKRTAHAQFVELLKGSKKIVDFSEVSQPEGEDTVQFADGAAIGKAAEAYIAEQAGKGITIGAADAVRHVTKGQEKK